MSITRIIRLGYPPFLKMLPALRNIYSIRRKLCKPILVSVLAVIAELSLAGPAFGQSLAKLAQEAGERISRGKGTTKVYTNDDLNAASPPSAPTPVPAPAPRQRESSMTNPLSINATLTSGIYSTYTRGGGNPSQHLEFVPAGATFDINGFYLTPDFIDYWVQPELNAGPQASDAGFTGGNGVSLRVTFLRHRAFPVTFRYSNVQLKDVYFGSLSQISSYSRHNRNKELGLTSEWKIAGLPTATIDWGTNAVNSEAGINAIPDYLSHSKHLNLDSSYEHWGWTLQGFVHRQELNSDLFTPKDQHSNTFLLRQKVLQYQGSARRSLFGDSELSLDLGSQSTSNLLLDHPIDLTTRYGTANLRLAQTGRWKTSLRAGYTSNISSLLLTQLAGSLAGNGSIAPDSSVLSTFHRKIAYLNLNVLTSVDLSHGFGLFASGDRTSVLTASDSRLNSSYFTTAGGVTYAGSFRWGSLSFQYGRSLGMGAVSRTSGRIEGQNYMLASQHDIGQRLQLNLSVRGIMQRVRSQQPADDRSFSSDVGVGLRLIRDFRFRLGGGWQHSTFTNSGTKFDIQGYSAQVGLEHPRFQLSGSLNTSVGSSLQAYRQQFGGIGVGAAVLTTLNLIPSDLRGRSLTIHANPFRKLELSALWTSSVQHLEGLVANDFKILDVHATYHFRRLQFEFGYFRSLQVFSSYLAIYPATERGRFYIRIWRNVKLL